MVKKHLKLILLIAGLLVVGCAQRPDIQVLHSPVIATSAENVTFAATLLKDGDGPAEVEIYVNDTLVHTCSGLTTGATCVYTGGPYAAYEDMTVSYRAQATDSDGHSRSRGHYAFAITDSSYNYSDNVLPARVGTADNFDLLFHRAGDYPSFGEFVDDVEDKIYDVYGEQEIIRYVGAFDKLDFYVYAQEAAGTADCGFVHPDTDGDMTEREYDAVLHKAILSDCTSPVKRSFTAEGGNTKAFLHESGHAVFGLADEYDAWGQGCNTNYNWPGEERNIWSTEAACRAEQTDKDRDPDACHKFTNCQGGWWGIQQLDDGTVMQIGMVGDPWGIEATERVNWWLIHTYP